MQHVYDNEFESFCYQNCLRQILEYYGVKNAKLYINMSLDFNVHIKDDEVSIYDKGTRSLVPEWDFLVRREYFGDDKETTAKVWKENIYAVEKGQPIIVGVDTYYLNYLPYYHKNHGKHTVILGGYNKERDSVAVLDWYAPWFFSGEIPKEDFLDARRSRNESDGSVYSGDAIKNNWASIEKMEMKCNASELIYNQLQHSYEQYYIEKNEENEFNGIFAVKRLRDNWIETISILSEEKIVHQLALLHSRVFRSNKRRNFFCLLLSEGMKLGENSIMEFARLEMKNIYEAWEILQYIILKAKIRPCESNYQKIIVQLTKIIELEEQYEGRLLELIKQMS